MENELSTMNSRQQHKDMDLEGKKQSQPQYFNACEAGASSPFHDFQEQLLVKCH